MPTCGTSARLSAVNAGNEQRDMSERIRSRMAQINESEPESIAGMLRFRLVSCERDDITMTCQTMPWMRNPAGTLHGGMGAAILDQAMGFVAYCIKPGEGIAPTIQMQVSYHRPLISGEDVIVKVWVVSATRSLMSFRSEAFQAASPEKLCVSGSATYFFKPAK